MYAHLVAGADAEVREQIDDHLSAPPQGWETVQRRFFALLEEVG